MFWIYKFHVDELEVMNNEERQSFTREDRSDNEAFSLLIRHVVRHIADMPSLLAFANDLPFFQEPCDADPLATKNSRYGKKSQTIGEGYMDSYATIPKKRVEKGYMQAKHFHGHKRQFDPSKPEQFTNWAEKNRKKLNRAYGQDYVNGQLGPKKKKPCL